MKVMVAGRGQFYIEAKTEEEYLEKLEKFLERLSEIMSFDIDVEETENEEWFDE